MHKYRTLVRITAIDQHWVMVTLPGWDSRDERIPIPSSYIPSEHRQVGYRFYARVNLGAENRNDLDISDFEFIST